MAYYLKLLTNGNTDFIELPTNLQGLLNVRDMSAYNIDRYYVGHQQKELFRQIYIGTKVYTEMMAYGLPYSNSTLIYGDPGTGKTEFAKYVAYKLGLQYAYLNFSYLIDAYMGKTANNIQRAFDHCKGMQCVLMVDEIDCIGIKRSNRSPLDGELGRITVALMQCLDELVDGQVVIAATNRCDILDPALLRRFQRKVEFTRYSKEEELSMIKHIVDHVDVLELNQEMLDYSAENHTQSETLNYLTGKISEKVMERIQKNEDSRIQMG